VYSFDDMEKVFKVFVLTGIIAFGVMSCVPKRQLEDVKAKYEAERAKAKDYHEKSMKCEAENNEMKAAIAENAKRLAALQRDTAIQGTSLRQLSRNYDQLDKTYRELLALKEAGKKRTELVNQTYLKELEESRLNLQNQEDKLNEAIRALADKEASLKEKNLDLENSQKDLAERSQRIIELQGKINRQDSIAQALKKKISDALFGLESEGLSVELKNGKVYVSLDNELLFKAGSYTADEKGKKALKKLADVLNSNEDINITVEGHTDIDKYRGGAQLKDNWDLSVMRATQIVKVLEGYKVNPGRLIASGRGEHLPLDPEETKEAKKKNRRTEIILTPKLDLLGEILGN
jgi:chemotaxis protein MotB